MTDLKKHEGVDVQAALIELVKRDDIDPSRLEHFLELQVKMEDRQNEKLLNNALCAFQSDCPIIKKTKKTHNSTYAPLDEIVHTIKPYLKANGLSYSFSIETKEAMENEITVHIRHVSGASMDSKYTFPRLDDGGKMNTSQKTKSANSYAKRVALENALGIVTADIDDDAKRAVDNSVTSEQIEQIESLAKNTDTTMQSLLKFLKVEKLEDLSEYEAKRAITALKTKRTATSGVK